MESINEIPPDDPREADLQRYKLTTQMQNGASWFFWIAGFSLINFLLIVFGAEINFIVGLGVTTLSAVMFHVVSQNIQGNLALLANIVCFVVTLAAAGTFIGLGAVARRGHIWAFCVGMFLYACDGLIFVWLEDWLSVGFHVFALFCLYGGLTAARQLIQVEPSPAAPA